VGGDEEQIEVEWLGYEHAAPSAERGGIRWGQLLVGAAGGAFAALAATALVGWSSSDPPLESTTTTTTTQPRPPLVGAADQAQPLDGLSDDVVCASLGGPKAC